MAIVKIITTQNGAVAEEFENTFQIWEELESEINRRNITTSDKEIGILEHDNIDDMGRKNRFKPINGSAISSGNINVYITPKKMKGAMVSDETIQKLMTELEKKLRENLKNSMEEVISDSLRDLADDIDCGTLNTNSSSNSEDTTMFNLL